MRGVCHNCGTRTRFRADYAGIINDVHRGRILSRESLRKRATDGREHKRVRIRGGCDDRAIASLRDIVTSSRIVGTSRRPKKIHSACMRMRVFNWLSICDKLCCVITP